MPEVSTHAPGAFCWIDLGTSDAAGAKKFYADLLGWEFEDSPMSEGGVYTMIRLNGKDVGGLYELSDEMKSQGIPPNWLSYISVENCDETTNKAESAGAEIKMGPMDVMDVGRMSVIQDPTGAVFAVWQAKRHNGCAVLNEPGAVCWNELATGDVGAAKGFYTDVFGYTMADQHMGPMSYTFLMMGEARQGGVMKITPEMGPVPPHWMIYFSVADCEATVGKATAGGANVLVPSMDVPGVGRMAVLQDPQGAAFSVIALES